MKNIELVFKDKTVAIYGGGNSAIDGAIYLSDICKKVYLIHRRDEFRGEESTINLLKEKDNIEFLYNSNVTKLNTKDRLESIEVTSNDGEIRTIDVDALFIAIGRIPENQNFAKLINLDNAGYIISNEYCHTNVEGIFVAGDNRVKELRQLVTATSDGAIAAIETYKYIKKGR